METKKYKPIYTKGDAEPTYLDIQAEVGISKHMGGLAATDTLHRLCHLEEAQEVLEVVWVPTLEPFEGTDSGNLRSFIDAGGVVAMGNDSGYIAGLTLGMPMPELEYMHAAGMTPLEVIVASTRNAAYVCDRLSTLGTLEVGKFTDVLVVEGDPLQDLQALKNVRLVVHGGVIIREED
jgi:imidazolonepropionase-like amidohydrolase